MFCSVAQMLAERESYSEVRTLIQALESTQFASETLNDDIAMAAIKVATSKQSKDVCVCVGGGGGAVCVVVVYLYILLCMCLSGLL